MWADLLKDKSALATALELLGDKWTLMIVSGNFASVHRFNELEQSLGINRNILSSRLNKLIEANVVEKIVYQERPRRYEYRLTDIGRELRPVIIGLAAWSEKNITREDTPISMVHTACLNKLNVKVFCAHCEEFVPPNDVVSKLNPNAGEEAIKVFEEIHTPLIEE